MTPTAEPTKAANSSILQRWRQLNSRAWLIIMIALILILLITGVPVLLKMQSFKTTGEKLVQDTMATYSAKAGIEDVMWKFGNRQQPFTPASPPDSSYVLPEKVNNMTVQVKLLKYTRIGTTDRYFVQSTALPGPNSRAKIVVEIQQQGATTTLVKYSRE